jgi:two-component system, OmpR family, heavy metal sensor histidine kinase CusS
MTSLRSQLIRTFVLGAAVLLALGGGAVYLLTRRALIGQFDTALRAKALAVSVATEQDGDRITIDGSERLTRPGDRRAADVFQLRQADGRSLLRSESLNGMDLVSAAGATEPYYWDMTLPGGVPGRAIALQFHLRPSGERDERPLEDADAVTLVLGSDRRELDRTLQTLGLMLVGTGLTLLAAVVTAVPRLLKSTMRPLDRLGRQAAGMTARKLSARFSTDVPRELAPITGGLNDLLSRLEQSFDRERRFSSDLAHELRTPVAELRTMAEVALRWPEAREDRTDHATLAIARRMEGIVSRLLALLRSEDGQLEIAREPLALGPLLTDIWRPFAPKAAAKAQSVVWLMKPDGDVVTDPVLLRSIVTNLMENAVNYTPDGGTISIATAVSATRFDIEVTNTVADVTADDVSRFFDRMWRRDTSRTSAEHSGLGLPLARSFARALGGDLEASLGDGGDLTLRLTLVESGDIGRSVDCDDADRSGARSGDV